jgi:hypothetical protein
MTSQMHSRPARESDAASANDAVNAIEAGWVFSTKPTLERSLEARPRSRRNRPRNSVRKLQIPFNGLVTQLFAQRFHERIGPEER